MREQTRILIVDDERAVRDMLRRGLEQAGYRCETASNANEAIYVLSVEA